MADKNCAFAFECVGKVIDFIEENLSEELRLKDLTEMSGFSHWHFQKMFRVTTGDSISSYIKGRRLTRAAKLLRKDHASILDVALESGFKSHEVFTRSFKEKFGVSPKNFKFRETDLLLDKKPALDKKLFDYIFKGMDLVPEIKINEKISLIGFGTSIPSPFSTEDSYCMAVYESWMSMISAQLDINDRINEHFYGLTISDSGAFTETDLGYMAAVPVIDRGVFENYPDMDFFEIPEQKVAIFTINQVDADSVNKIISYIYGYWLPNSPYKRGVGCDYELFERGVYKDRPPSQGKYVIPIEGL